MSNKSAVVTGATKGIGRAVTEMLAREGYDVFINSRTEVDLERFQSELKKQYPDQNFPIFSADLSEKQGVDAFSQAIQSEWDQLHVLVNNAGVFRPGEILQEEEGQLELQVNTNLYSAYYLTRALIGMMKKAPWGHIFNMCSVASLMAYPGGGSYCISKFALLGFSKVLRKELQATKIKVTALMPGATWSDSWAGADFPEDRLMQPEDIARAVKCALDMGASATMEEIVIRPQQGDL
ncbi:MAG TPA: SDR family oxidoreductase [Saprospiraceae bacterium]|nr:SDR family oxidoreductase [Saprospiraceae bacterium]